jgi:endonuclease/exonuclease/phosphatase family metal-dependent hydrolase
MRVAPGSPMIRDVPPGDRRTERSARQGTLQLALVGLLVTLSLQSFRVLFPLAYNFGERTSFTSAGALALVLFLAPFLSPGIRGALGGRASLMTSVVGLAAVRLATQFLRPVPLWLGGTGVVFALVALSLAYLALRADGGRGGGRFVLGLLLGMSVDTSVLAAFRTWEPSWQETPAAAITAIVLVALATVAAWRAPLPEGPVRAGVWQTATVGPFLTLHVLFLQNVAFTASATETHLPAATAMVLAGDLLGLLAVTWALGRQPGVPFRVAAAAALVIVAAVLNETSGPAAVAVFFAAHPLAAFALATSLSREGRPGGWRAGAGVGLGSVGFLLLTLLFYLHYDVPLPFPNVALTPIAAAILAAGAIRPSPASAPRRSWWPAALPAGLLLVPVALASAMPVPGARAPGVESLRVVDYNVHTTVNVRGQADPEAVARVIDAQDPDVVVLQEVSRGWAVSGSIDTAEWLSERLGLSYVFVEAADNGFGNAILSRFPLLRTDEGFLPKGVGPMDRSWIRALLDLGEGHTVSIIGTHLHHQHDGPEDDRTRLEQIGTLLGVWGGASRTVIAGDMNARPGSEELARFEAAGLETAGDLSIPTSPSTDPRNRIDYIFATPDLELSEAAFPKSTASDHLAVAATVTFAAGF